MTALYLLPAWLSLLTLAAHFLRAGDRALLLAVLLIGGSLALRRWWVARIAQTALALGTIEWLWTLAVLASARKAAGEPYLRLIVILGVVALVTACSALLFQTTRLRQRYGLGDGGGP